MQEMKNGSDRGVPRNVPDVSSSASVISGQGIANEADILESCSAAFNREPRRIRADRQVFLFPRPCLRALAPC